MEYKNNWSLYEVFIRSKQGLSHRHVGSLRAPDDEVALQNARDVYTRRNEGTSIWVVKSELIRSSQPEEKPEFLNRHKTKSTVTRPSIPFPMVLSTCNAETTYEHFSIFTVLLHIGDSHLILSHRLSEWCGHAPELELDIALANIGLDLLGQARTVLSLAGEIEGQGRDEDRLAYFRHEREYRNLLLTEQPNGDFGQTIVRQWLMDHYHALLFRALSESKHEGLAAFAVKSLKEVSYHLRFQAHGWSA